MARAVCSSCASCSTRTDEAIAELERRRAHIDATLAELRVINEAVRQTLEEQVMILQNLPIDLDDRRAPHARRQRGALLPRALGAAGAEWREAGHMPLDTWREAGAQRPAVRQQRRPTTAAAGGDFGHDAVIFMAATRAVLSGYGGGLHSAIVAPYFFHCGTEEQKRRWLPKMAAGELVGAIAMTEPGTGSRPAGGAHAAPCRDGDHYVINGSKTFITNGQNANLIIVVVQDRPRRWAPRAPR